LISVAFPLVETTVATAVELYDGSGDPAESDWIACHEFIFYGYLFTGQVNPYSY